MTPTSLAIVALAVLAAPGANLRGADLWGANLRDAKANESTRVPVGWVVAHGQIERAQ